MKNTKFVFYLMNEKGYTVLDKFIGEFGCDAIEYIVLSKDESIKNDYYKEIVSVCKKANIKYYDRKNEIPFFDGYKFAIGWRWIIKDNRKLIVLHDSLLPKYRGFAPLVNMLINGEKEVGVTALMASDDYDCGDIITQEKITINYPIKIENAIKLIAPLYYLIIKKMYLGLKENDELIKYKQSEEEATYSLWRDDKDYLINWNDSAEEVQRFVDAVGYPYNGAKTYINDELVTVNDVEIAQLIKLESRNNMGKIVFVREGKPIVACGKGFIQINSITANNGEELIPLNRFRIRFTSIKSK